MPTSNTDRVTTSWMSTFATALWTKIKNTFVNISGTQTITGQKTFSDLSSTFAGTSRLAVADQNGNTIDETYATKGEIPTGVVKTSTDQTIYGVKTFATNPVIQASSGTSSIYVKQTGANNYLGLAYYADGSRAVYDSRTNKTFISISDGGTITFDGLATKATADASGNTITSTYATKSELTSGLSTKQNASNAVTTNTDQSIWNVKTFKASPIIKANSGTSSINVTKTDSNSYLNIYYRADGSRGMYDTASGTSVISISGNAATFNGTATNASSADKVDGVEFHFPTGCTDIYFD